MKYLFFASILTLTPLSFALNMTQAGSFSADAAATAATLDLPVNAIDYLAGTTNPRNLITRFAGDTFGYSCRNLCKEHWTGSKIADWGISGVCGAFCGSAKYSFKKLAEGRFTPATPWLGAINNGLYGATENTNGPVDESLKIILIESIEDLVAAALSARTIFIGWKKTEDVLKGSAWTGTKVALSLWFIYSNLHNFISDGIKYSSRTIYSLAPTQSNSTQGDL